LHAFHQQWFTPSNFIVAASGDFERDAFVAKLEQLFADWPFFGGPPPPVPTNTTFAPPGVYLVDKTSTKPAFPCSCPASSAMIPITSRASS
jgi:zinc protease